MRLRRESLLSVDSVCNRVVQGEFCCVSPVKGSDPDFGEEIDSEVELEFRVLCACCVLISKEKLVQGAFGSFR